MNAKNALPIFFLLILPVPASLTSQEPSTESQEFEMTVPEGTVIPIILTAYLNTKSSQIGDTVYSETTYPVWIQQKLVIPRGSLIRGTVTDVIRPGKIKGRGKLAVRFDDILLPNGVKRDFSAIFRGMHGAGDESLDRKSETVSGGGSAGDDVGTVVGTTSTGTIIGAVAGRSGKGAGIGAAAGAAGGLATVLFTRGRDLVLSPGTQFDLELRKPMKFAYNELDFTNDQLNSAERHNQQRYVNPSPNPDRNRRDSPFPRLGIPLF